MNFDNKIGMQQIFLLKFYDFKLFALQFERA